MNLEDVIERFCSHCANEREQAGNAGATKNTGCSRCSQRSQIKNIQPLIEDQINPINLHEIIVGCCHGLAVSALQVCDNLLSTEDKQDIINGDISRECIRAHIIAWVDQGIPHYATTQCHNT